VTLSATYNLKALFPGIANQWHPVKNGDLTPDKVATCSIKKVWWMCDKGHEWQAAVTTRFYGSGCPYCSGMKAKKEYNLLTVKPDLARQRHKKMLFM
jgi:hypothetical protein